MAAHMEIDGEMPSLDNGGSTLKRSNSAPMINMLVDAMCTPTARSQDDSGKPAA